MGISHVSAHHSSFIRSSCRFSKFNAISNRRSKSNIGTKTVVKVHLFKQGRVTVQAPNLTERHP